MKHIVGVELQTALGIGLMVRGEELKAWVRGFDFFVSFRKVDVPWFQDEVCDLISDFWRE